MKYIFVLIINLIFIQTSYSQIYEIGGFIGNNNIVGDVGEQSFFGVNRLAYGAVVKWNRSTRHAWRFSAITNYKTGGLNNDTSSGLGELSGGIEFNFFEFNLHEVGFQHTPYIYTGLSGVLFKEIREVGTDPLTATTNEKLIGKLAIPMILGYKFRVLQSFVIGAEIGARYSFTDMLDGQAVEDYNNDWYVFTGFTLTYTFGRKPCYCTN